MTEGTRTDRSGLLLGQFDQAREMAQVRLKGLGDDEYLWEPVAGSWSIRRRGESPTPRAYGPGEWVLDRGVPDIPASEYAEVARQAAGGMAVSKIADDWSVSVDRVEQVLAHSGEPEPDETPVTTIAWRLGHLHSCLAGQWEWTFGERRREPRLLVDFFPSASVALDRFWDLIGRWRDGVAAVTEEQLDTVGFSQYPYGSDPDDPFAAVPAGANLEYIHHMAEISLIRDLWRGRSTTSG
ncbi:MULTISPECIES: DinB family protein [Streptomyces]|uniref:DinB family protein n=1 Tax=Streptomyces glycanivorans TaxID=3033808 RepID=A0ABY9J4B0_9ACTN|nr:MULTISPECIES: DinB family protein [unclassified Streptomyces]TXS13133.1 DinB family protein [Streptomyces sp. wa22]WLQ62658.1 DinB family protein [Streptomyces sp. Alt3]WSR46751.1 DinB family protein [Streptomyces sp. NBC_01201]